MKTDKLLDLKNVVGYSEGEDPWNKEDTVTVFVRQKKPLEELRPQDVIPRIVKTGVFSRKPTDVVEIGDVTVHANRKQYRPLKGGCEIGILGQMFVGTAGAILKFKKFGGRAFFDDGLSLLRLLEYFRVPLEEGLCILTNAHVTQTDVKNPARNDITQPGVRSQTYKIGKVLYTVPVTADGWNEFDTSIVEIDQVEALQEVIVVGKYSGAKNPAVGDKVHKYGRTTLYTKGKCVAAGVKSRISGYPGIDGLVSFKDLLMFQNEAGTGAMSDRGDSGSVIFHEDGRAAALLFAGSGTVTFGIPIEKVIAKTGVLLG